MVRLDRTGRISRGKFTEAIQWATDAAAYLNTTHGTKFEVFAQRFGPAGVIVWQSDFGSVAEVDATLTKMNADPKWIAMLTTSAEKGLFIEGSIVDRLLVSLG